MRLALCENVELLRGEDDLEIRIAMVDLRRGVGKLFPCVFALLDAAGVVKLFLIVRTLSSILFISTKVVRRGYLVEESEYAVAQARQNVIDLTLASSYRTQSYSVPVLVAPV